MIPFHQRCSPRLLRTHPQSDPPRNPPPYTISPPRWQPRASLSSDTFLKSTKPLPPNVSSAGSRSIRPTEHNSFRWPQPWALHDRSHIQLNPRFTSLDTFQMTPQADRGNRLSPLNGRGMFGNGHAGAVVQALSLGLLCSNSALPPRSTIERATNKERLNHVS
jgi:hypothetical protein